MKLPEKWQKVVGKMVTTLFNKVLGENENVSFIVTLKPKELFGQPNTFLGCRKELRTRNKQKEINYVALIMIFLKIQRREKSARKKV